MLIVKLKLILIMYEVTFQNTVKGLELPFAPKITITVSDLEIALALASMLGKISTPEVQFGDINVVPFYNVPVDDETKS